MAFAAPFGWPHGAGHQTDGLRRLCESGQIALDALTNLKLAVAVLDAEGRLLLANPSFERLFGDDDDALRAAIEAAGGEPREIAFADGRAVRIETAALPQGLLVTAEDVSDRLAEQAHAAAAARVDALTGLGNGLSLIERLTALAAAPALEASPAAVLTIGLDRLRAISEPLGNPLGEATLRAAADRMRTVVGPEDALVRLDGDKFGVLQPGQPQPAAAAALAHRITDMIGRPFVLEGHLLTLDPRVGIALMPLDGRDAAQILRSADVALSLARRAAPGAVRFFESAMERQIETRRRFELDLRRALTLREFGLVYQPQVNLASGRITGFESLLRWHSPIHGEVSPAAFIPLAEDSGLIVTIGAWGLRTACREAAGWPQPLTIAVNVSSAQVVDPGFITVVRNALSESGLDPRRLELEITESVLMQDDGTALDVLRTVRQLGVRVSMDDFGTGYSSLSRLHSFPFDKIKIDQSFVRAGPDHPSGRMIVRAIAALGGSLGIDTTAEGVETEEQLARVLADGCTEVQGFLFGRPAPPERICDLLQAPAIPAPPAA